MNHNGIHIIGVKGEEETKQGIEKLYGEIKTKNSVTWYRK